MCGASGSVGGHWPSELNELVRWYHAIALVDSSSVASLWIFWRTRSCHGLSSRAMGVLAQVDALAPCQEASSSNVSVSFIGGSLLQASSKVMNSPIARHAVISSISLRREAGVRSNTLSGLFWYFSRNH